MKITYKSSMDEGRDVASLSSILHRVDTAHKFFANKGYDVLAIDYNNGAVIVDVERIDYAEEKKEKSC